MFTSGVVVRIQGLVNRQDLNGELGVVDQTENGKTTLALLSNPAVKLAMRSKNLCLAVKCGTCAAYVANEGDLFCLECMRVKRARVDPAVGASVLDVLAAAALLPARLEPPVPPARPAAASPATHNPPESPAPVAQAPVVQPPAAPVNPAPVVRAPVAQPQATPVVRAPVAQPPATPVAQPPATPVVQAPVAQPPATPVVQAPLVQAPATPVVRAPLVQAPATPVVQAPATPVVRAPVAQPPAAPVAQPPAAPVVQAPVVASRATEQAELEERIVRMFDSFDFLEKGTDELPGLLRRALRERESVSFKFLFQLSHCYQFIHVQNVQVLCKRTLEGLLDQTAVGWNLQRVDRLTEMVEEQFPFFKKMLEMDKLYGFYNHGFIPEAIFSIKFYTLYGQAVDVCHQHLVDERTVDFTNHLYFLYSIAFFDRETLFNQFFLSGRFPDELNLYRSMATIAGDYTQNIYSMFGQTISGGMQNKLAIFKAISETVPKTKVDYDAAVVRLLESIEGPIERTLAVCTKLLEEELIDEKHFEFVVDKMFA